MKGLPDQFGMPSCRLAAGHEKCNIDLQAKVTENSCIPSHRSILSATIAGRVRPSFWLDGFSSTCATAPYTGTLELVIVILKRPCTTPHFLVSEVISIKNWDFLHKNYGYILNFGDFSTLFLKKFLLVGVFYKFLLVLFTFKQVLFIF